MKAIPLESDRLIFEPLTLNHLSQDYVDWLNDPEVFKYLETGGNYSLDMLADFLKQVEKQNIYFWAIRLKETKRHIGNIKIDPISIRNSNGEYGIMMGDRESWGKGYAYEASKRIIDYFFQEDLLLMKITLGVVANNVAAHKLYLKLGFKEEGCYHSHSIHNGEYLDVIRMAIFNPAFFSNE
jgi:ribosomal-protein-alanine N-acetyltransferase